MVFAALTITSLYLIAVDAIAGKSELLKTIEGVTEGEVVATTSVNFLR